MAMAMAMLRSELIISEHASLRTLGLSKMSTVRRGCDPRYFHRTTSRVRNAQRPARRLRVVFALAIVGPLRTQSPPPEP
jgi:hypothetical protein